jgi:hypothetical protein
LLNPGEIGSYRNGIDLATRAEKLPILNTTACKNQLPTLALLYQPPYKLSALIEVALRHVITEVWNPFPSEMDARIGPDALQFVKDLGWRTEVASDGSHFRAIR